MTHRIPALWIALLTALLASPLVQSPKATWPAEALLQLSDASGTSGHALPTARIQSALHLRSPLDRQGHAWAVPPLSQGPVVTSWPICIRLDDRCLTLPAESARHYPLFPTGPPPHG